MNRRWILSFFRMASLLMLLVAVGLMSAILTMHFAIHGAEVQVPALKGMTVADARNETAGLGLILDVDNRYYSGDVAAGHILTQSPSSGTVVRREWRVRVSESLGPQKVNVPDTVGMEERTAALALRRAGLEVGATAHLPEPDASGSAVLAQDPPAHAQDIEKPSVSLLVAVPDTAPPDGYVMPDLTGLPIVTAQMALAKVGIKTSAPTYQDAAIQNAPGQTGGAAGEQQSPSPGRAGSVVAQQPAVGARVDQSTEVKLTVSK
jgi:beta-lactam-binding protein with PASTA domain